MLLPGEGGGVGPQMNKFEQIYSDLPPDVTSRGEYVQRVGGYVQG